MSGSLNKVILIGNVGRDPEVRRMNSGEAVVNFSLATSESWRDKSTGERKDRTEWHNIVIFNEALAKVAEQYIRKGSKIFIEGQLQTRKFMDKTGVERQTTEVVLQRYRGELTLLDARSSGSEAGESVGSVSFGGGNRGGDFGRETSSSSSTLRQSSNHPDIDDDIPF
ncbi:MAG: single-stranded DNA-binding protein [Hyphomicrobiales bacterium]